jgi:hypothetical protein
MYPSLHYWAPSLYYWKAMHRPVQYSQYAPGPDPSFVVDQPAATPKTPPAKQPEFLPPPEKANK